jgi:hypothetical protein
VWRGHGEAKQNRQHDAAGVVGVVFFLRDGRHLMNDLIPIIAGLAGTVLVASAVPWRSMLAKLKPLQPTGPTVRGADDPPPEGSQDWVLDIMQACGAASAETVLQCLEDGLTRDQARAVRIAELQSEVAK